MGAFAVIRHAGGSYAVAQGASLTAFPVAPHLARMLAVRYDGYQLTRIFAPAATLFHLRTSSATKALVCSSVMTIGSTAIVTRRAT